MQLIWDKAQEEINNGVVVLTFKTSWCGDCKMMDFMTAPMYEELRAQGLSFKTIEVDAEEAKLFRASGEWEVLKVPSFYLIKDGVKKHLGYEFIPIDLIKEEIIKALK